MSRPFKATVIEDIFSPAAQRPTNTNSSGIKNTSQVHNWGQQLGSGTPARPQLSPQVDRFKGFNVIEPNINSVSGQHQGTAQGSSLTNAGSGRYSREAPQVPARSFVPNARVGNGQEYYNQPPPIYGGQEPSSDRYSNKLKPQVQGIQGASRDYQDYNIIPESETDTIRGAIASMFPDFHLIKVENKETPDKQVFGIYKALVDTMTAADTKYISVIIPKDSNTPLGTTKFLSGMKWVSFQTRSTEWPSKEMNGYRLGMQNYNPPMSNSGLLKDVIHLSEERNDKWVYQPENVPVKVELLKRHSDEYFSPKSNLLSALQQWNTVVTII